MISKTVVVVVVVLVVVLLVLVGKSWQHSRLKLSHMKKA
jgi:hypothetical protein